LSSVSEGEKVVIDSIRSAGDDLRSIMNDEAKIRDIDLIWKVYAKVELAIGIGKYLVTQEDRLGRLNELRSSITNDPAIMPLDTLKKNLLQCESELEYAEYDFETTGGTQAGLQAARRCRDSLKSLLLGHRKNVRGRLRRGKK